MFQGVFLTLLYAIGLIDPHIRYAFYPVHILAAWTEKENEIAINWSTGLPVYGAVARYREVSCDFLPREADWRVVQPNWNLFFKYVIFWEVIHTAILPDLDSTCEYEYQVGTGFYLSDILRISGRTPYYNFNEEKSKLPAKLIIYGDMGIGENSTATRSFLKKFISANPDVAGIVHLGDVAYNLDYNGGMVGDEFLNDLSGISDRLPYMFAPGNHEAAHNFTHFRARFRMPVTQSNSGTNFFYSFNLGYAHFVIYSTEVYAYNSPETVETQYNWLMDDLNTAQLNRSSVPWIFVLGHKPLYCNVDWRRPMESIVGFRSNDNCAVESPALQTDLEDLFYNHSVDALISGHVHKYEREAAIYKNLTVSGDEDTLNFHKNPAAPIYIISGIAGSDHGKNPISSTPQLWSRFESNGYGFGVLTVFNKTHVFWEQYDAETEEKVDFLWIEKTRIAY